jgi:hypothetical protein
MASNQVSVWKSRLKTVFQLLAKAVLILAVSVFILVQRGTTMCDPFFLLPLSLFSALLVGPILIEELRKHSNRSTVLLVIGAAARASGAVLLILILSLALVNLASSYGHVVLPTAETCIWTIVLSVTAAMAAGAGLLVFRSGGSLSTVKWVSRGLGLAAVLLYRYLPAEWSYSWYGVVLDWGITPTALGFEIVLVVAASIALILVRRQEAVNTCAGVQAQPAG